jgi:hydroxyacylglutathione hydrolase
MKIRDKLYLISGGSYGELGNAYLIKTKNGYLMVDSSKPDALTTIRNNLAYWKINEEEILAVLLTHGHDDHAGCAAYFQSRGAKLYVGADNEMLQKGDFGPCSPFTNHVAPPCVADIILKEDQNITINDLQISVYPMPGHTDGTIIYYAKVDDDRILFTGDMFFVEGETGTDIRTGWKGDLSYNAEKLGMNFQKLWNLNLDPNIILGGHGIPLINNNAKEAIRAAYKYFLLNNR